MGAKRRVFVHKHLGCHWRFAEDWRIVVDVDDLKINCDGDWLAGYQQVIRGYNRSTNRFALFTG
jgi:hypothetical protein